MEVNVSGLLHSLNLIAMVKQHCQHENIIYANLMALSDPSIHHPPNRISTISEPE